MGWVVAASTVVAAADLGAGWLGSSADAVVPSPPQVAELYDLNEFLTDAARPTANLITVKIERDGTASFELPRAEVGQGIVTSTAMLIAEELDLPLDKVDVTLAPARPELNFNQLTAASNTTISTYVPIRIAAAAAKLALVQAASDLLGDAVESLTTRDGVVSGPSGSFSYAELTTSAAAIETQAVNVVLKSPADFRVIGTPRGRTDAREAVTGTKVYAMDKKVKGAKPTMVARPPTLNGSPRRIRNKKKVLKMPGVTHVVKIPTGVAVRAKTFGQCIEAIRALKVDWNPGSVEGLSDKDIVRRLRSSELPVPDLPLDALPGTKVIDNRFTFYFKSNSSLEPNGAIADVKPGRARIWGPCKSPIVAQQEIANDLGMRQDQVEFTVMQAGGSFGRKLFFDAALEAARISKKIGKPVKLMWHRADEPRQGRAHPMAISRVRATMVGDEVIQFDQRHTSVETDYRHGLGDIISATAAKLPAGTGNLGYAQTVFVLTQEVPFNFGAVTQLLGETDLRFNTGSMRNIYSPDVRMAVELTMDEMAREMGMDRLAFRRKFVKDDRTRTVLNKVAKEGGWGRRLPKGVHQGIAIHKEYKGVTAALVELDMRPRTVDRDIRDAVTGPRVRRVTFAVDAGQVVNPKGLEAQMMGGINDGIAMALTSSMHLRNGRFLEASWDNYFYTRQWNTPPRVDIHIIDTDIEEPGGAGEAGVAATCSAVACAYGAAIGRTPTYFPINHRDEIAFKPKTFVPPVPPSPKNGLRFAR
ncbi:molybdopterin-dependent oxidoreductase [Nocardioidaceae bacterium]|nr:molybdopterin-dependent oxidoreductase [Nocardioidaceae bacterium]